MFIFRTILCLDIVTKRPPRQYQEVWNSSPDRGVARGDDGWWLAEYGRSYDEARERDYDRGNDFYLKFARRFTRTCQNPFHQPCSPPFVQPLLHAFLHAYVAFRV